MNKKKFIIISLLVLSTPVSIGANAINFEKVDVKEELSISELKYDDFRTMNVEEMERTKGKVGPLIPILVAAAVRGGAGAAVGIGQAFSTAPGYDPTVNEIWAGGIGGFVGGLVSPLGILPAGALGLSAWGAAQHMIGSGNGGNVGSGSGCGGCHH
ncbi:hypothetical protein ABLB69_06565 [Xenorhabdus khoisanae]|uniref:hypothetical protein n=1 Tax=Xenorhabdus khoisanae TaxID=880157 RepID=UPI0032B84400